MKGKIMDLRYWLGKIVDFFVGVAVVILGLRVFFRLVDANPTTPFVEWIYRTSDSLMVPFRGIFPPAEIERGIVLDVSAIFAAIVYIIIGYILLSLIDLIPRRDEGVVTRRAAAKK